MPKFPWPPEPEQLRRVRPDHRRLRSGTLLVRIYARGGPFPATWGAFRLDGPLPSARFDHHDPERPEERRGVLYAATDLGTCVAETFQTTRVVDRFAIDRWVSVFRLDRPVRLLDLTGDWPTRAGASQAISSGPRSRAQAWARAVYAAYPEVEGLWYPSSMRAGRPTVVLFERVEDAIPDRPELDVPLSHPGLLPDLTRMTGSIGYLLR